MNGWKHYSDQTQIDWESEADAVVRSDSGTSIVRHSPDKSKFFVLAVSGQQTKIMKEFKSLEAARKYNYAIHK